MKTTAIIQARMSSKRFPGKSLYEVAGKPLIQYLFDRLERCLGLEKVIVATSRDASDDAIAAYCARHSVSCYRGDLENVAQRFLDVVQHYNLQHFVRVNGDSPLMDPRLIDQGAAHFSSYQYDLVTNIMPRTYPPGESVEVVGVAGFKKALALAGEPDDFEHVTRVFYKKPQGFKIFNFKAGSPYENIRLVVDTPEDMENFKAIVGRMSRPAETYGLDEVAALYRDIRKTAAL